MVPDGTHWVGLPPKRGWAEGSLDLEKAGSAGEREATLWLGKACDQGAKRQGRRGAMRPAKKFLPNTKPWR